MERLKTAQMSRPTQLEKPLRRKRIDPSPLKRIGDSVPVSEMGMKDFWFVLNKTESGEMTSIMLALLGDLSSKVIGSIPHDPGLVRAGLSGSPVGELKAIENVDPIVQRLEQTVSLQQKTT